MRREAKFDGGTRWGQPEERDRWLAEVERIGVEGMRVRVFHTENAGSGGSIKGVGTELSIPKGFAEEWLQWKSDRRSDGERGAGSADILDALGGSRGLARGDCRSDWLGFHAGRKGSVARGMPPQPL